MTVHWDVAQDLDLLKRICLRELREREVDEAILAGGRFYFRPYDGNTRAGDLSLPVRLNRGISLELTEVASALEFPIEDIVETAGRFADALNEIDSQRQGLVADIAETRLYLRSRIRPLRAAGLRIRGEVSLGRVGLDDISDIGPVITLHYPGEDLRWATSWFTVDGFEDIEAELEGLRDTVARRSRLLEELREVGAVGLIHPVVYGALAACDGGAADNVRAILANPEPYQDLTDVHGRRLIIFWANEVLTGNVPIAEGMRFVGDHLQFDKLPFAPSEAGSGGKLTDFIDLPGCQGHPGTVRRCSGKRGQRGTVYFEMEPVAFNELGMTVAR